MAAACFAALNLSLALLVSRARPRTAASTTVVVLLTATACASVVFLVSQAADPTGDTGGVLADTGAPLPFAVQSLANYVTLACLAFLPFVFPWRRLSARATMLVAGAIAALILPSLVFASYEAVAAPSISNVEEALRVGFPVLFVGGPALGALLFTHAYLTAASPVQRRQALVFLCAYALKVAILVNAASGLVADLVPDAGTGGNATGPTRTALMALSWTLDAALILTLSAVPLVILGWRSSGRARESLTADLVVLAFIAGGLAFRPLGLSGGLEYQLIRPLLLAYGILLFQVLAVDVRERRWVVASGALAAAGGIYVSIGETAGRGGFDAASAGGVALMTTVAALGVMGLLAMRALVESEGAGESRRLLVYRAALDAHARESQRASAADALRALRLELGVSEREHEQLAAQAGLGEALVPGARFLDRYMVLRELGRGGHGTVVLARDERLGRDVAIKKVSDDQRRDAAALERLKREMRLASALQHPNIVAVHDVEESAGEVYLVLEYVSGGTLQQRIDERGLLAEDEARALARDMLTALAALHARGIIHRDVKPSNILLDAQGTAKLGDFTIARSVVSGDTVGFTRDGIAAGTLAYMAPEQARGLPASPASDQYSLAATLVAALSGEPPIDVTGLPEHEARKRVAEDAPRVPDVSPALGAALARALAKAPEDRFASAEEMAGALDAPGERPARRKPTAGR